MTRGTIVLARLIRPEELTRRASLLLIPAIALIDIAKLLSLVGGLALTLTLGVYDAVARAGVGPCQAQGQGHKAYKQNVCPHLHLCRNCVRLMQPGPFQLALVKLPTGLVWGSPFSGNPVDKPQKRLFTAALNWVWG